MEKLFLDKEMKELDNYAISKFGIDEKLLMGYAGYNVYMTIKKVMEEREISKNGKIIVVCGRGNNGGDGYATAYLLKASRYNVKVFSLGKPSSEKKATYYFYSLYEKVGGEIIFIDGERDYDRFIEELKTSDLVIDALLGIGVKGEVRGIYKDIISFINAYSSVVISIDLPSGMPSDGSIGKLQDMVSADATVTMGYRKSGMLLKPQSKMCGEVIVADIGFPPPNFDVKGQVIELEDVKKFFKNRDIASHKGNYGHLLIVGGFSGLMGAPILAGISAYKVGVGLVSLLLPNIPSSKKAIPPILLDYYGDDYFLQEGDIEKVERILDRVTAIVIGPGLGRKQESAGLVKRVLRIGKERDIPVVVDADALYLLGEHKYDGGFVVLTPHIGEFVRISGYMKDEILKEPIRCALEFAKRNEVILHLKFASSITVLRDGVYYINPTGNPGMAVGGSGDVLAGMIGGMLAQRKDESIVPIIAYLFGMAGDIARDFVGEVSLTPENIMEYIPTAINRIKSNIF